MSRVTPLLWATLGLLVACQTRLPPIAPLALRSSAPVSVSPDPTTAASAMAWPGDRWWQHYGDAELTTLIEQALRSSPSLAAATARQARAVAAMQLQAASSGVHVDASAQVQRQRLSDNGLFPPKLLGISWYSISEVGLNIDYQPDLWRRQAQALKAAGAEAQAAAAERAQLAVAVAASVAQLYFTIRADESALELTRQSLALAGRNRHLAELRQAAELGSGDEVRSLDLQLHLAGDEVGIQEANLAVHRAALAALLDTTPGQLPDMTAAPPPALALQLPADAGLGLVARRGEISAARWRVEAGLANAAVAHRGFLPDISLRALLGFSSRDIGKLLSAGSAAPAFTAALSLPLYDAGATRARFDSAQAELDAAIAEYNNAILTAAREVNEALALRATAAARLASNRVEVADAEALRSSATQQLQRGVKDGRTVIAAELQLLNQRAGLLQAQRQLFDADLALIRALGGGYEEVHRE